MVKISIQHWTVDSDTSTECVLLSGVGGTREGKENHGKNMKMGSPFPPHKKYSPPVTHVHCFSSFRPVNEANPGGGGGGYSISSPHQPEPQNKPEQRWCCSWGRCCCWLVGWFNKLFQYCRSGRREKGHDNDDGEAFRGMRNRQPEQCSAYTVWSDLNIHLSPEPESSWNHRSKCRFSVLCFCFCLSPLFAQSS